MKLRWLAPFMIIFLAGCLNHNSLNSIHIQLQDDDNDFYTMQAVGTDQAMVFTLDLPKNAGRADCWLDHYVDGRLQGSTLNTFTFLSDDDANPKIYFSNQRLTEDHKQHWTLSIRQGRDLTTIQHSFELTNPLIIVAPLRSVDMQVGETAALGSIVVSEKEMYQTIESYADIQENIRRIKEVYVLKCKISEQNRSA